jgi:hypothetical protein
VQKATLYNKEGISVFARELDMLQQAGYVRVGNFLVPPSVAKSIRR